MNNLEKLLQDYETMGDWSKIETVFRTIPDESKCPARVFCKEQDHGNCVITRARWLLEEYVEIDSWEKIEEDATKTYSDYWKCAGMDCDTCPAVFKGFLTPYEYYNTDGFSVAIKCANAQKCDLVARCKKLGAVE